MESSTKMLKEINENPHVVAATIEQERPRVQELVNELKKRRIDLIVIAARGTSYHAAIYAKYLFEYLIGIPVSFIAPSMYTLYNRPVKVDSALVIGISQSGSSQDIVEVITESTAAGAFTVGVTNNPDSALSKAATATILCHAGQEESVAATKTYVAQLTALALFACTWADRMDLIESLKSTPEWIAKSLALDSRIQEVLPRYRYMHGCALIGRGFNYCTALEAALKLKETCYLEAQGYSAADFLHGPIAMVDEGFPVFLIAPPGQTLSSVNYVNEKLRAIKAETITFSTDQELLATAVIPIEMPAWSEEVLSPLIYTPPLQLFAAYLSTLKGLNPDTPRGLNKVTVTR